MPESSNEALLGAKTAEETQSDLQTARSLADRVVQDGKNREEKLQKKTNHLMIQSHWEGVP